MGTTYSFLWSCVNRQVLIGMLPPPLTVEMLETGYLFPCSASHCVILDALCLEEVTAQLKVQRLP